jgi:predicted PurR-regulated permease PerM
MRPRSCIQLGPLLRPPLSRLERLFAQNIARPLLLWCAAVAIIVAGNQSSPSLISYVAPFPDEIDMNTFAKLKGTLRQCVWVEVAVQSP